MYVWFDVRQGSAGIKDLLAELQALGDMAMSSAVRYISRDVLTRTCFKTYLILQVEREKVELALLKARGFDWEGSDKAAVELESLKGAVDAFSSSRSHRTDPVPPSVVTAENVAEVSSTAQAPVADKVVEKTTGTQRNHN